MADIKFPKKQEQRLIPKYLLEYATKLEENHPDPSADWGGSGSEYTAGTGIDITNNVISVNNDVAMKTDIPDVSDFVTSTELSTELEDYELKSEAFSGSYNDLSNKPDLSVYELKSEAFSGDYDDLTDKPDLSIYAETADLGDCAYLDENELSIAYSQITGTPTIPTKTSELTNDSGYITGVTWNDVTGKPTFATVATSGDYDDLIDKPDLSIYAQSANLATVATTGDYDDLTNKPTIPDAVSGTNDGTNWTTITIGSDTYNIPAGGGSSYSAGTGIDITNNTISVDTTTIALKTDIPTNYVTTNTNQSVITGEKTFVGSKKIKFKELQSGDKPGFTIYNYNSNEKGYLEYNPTDDGLFLGRYGNYRVSELGFKTSISGASHKLLVPNVTLSGTVTDYIPISVNNTKADSSGNISIAIPDVSNYYTKTEVDNLIPTVPTNVSSFTNDAGYITSSALNGYATETWVGNQGYITGITSNDVTTALGYTPGTSNFSGDYDDLTDKPSIPSTATSTSTVTPTTSAFMTSTTKTTETLTFTYTDNTTANITIVTSITDNTSNAMTGATVSTSTTLS